MDKQEMYLEKMVKHLPVLRAAVRITQQELANKIGITRQSMMAIETSKRQLLWSNYLALVLVFHQYEDSGIVLTDLQYVFDDLLAVICDKNKSTKMFDRLQVLDSSNHRLQLDIFKWIYKSLCCSRGFPESNTTRI